MSGADGDRNWLYVGGRAHAGWAQQLEDLADLRQRVDAIESRVDDLARQESEATQDIRESMQRMSDRLSTSGRREQWATEYELQEVRRRLLDYLGHEQGNLSLCSLVDVLIGEHEQCRGEHICMPQREMGTTNGEMVHQANRDAEAESRPEYSTEDQTLLSRCPLASCDTEFTGDGADEACVRHVIERHHEEGLPHRGDVYVRLSHAPVVRTDCYYDGAVMVDVDECGNAIGVEVLGSRGITRDGQEV